MAGRDSAWRVVAGMDGSGKARQGEPGNGTDRSGLAGLDRTRQGTERRGWHEMARQYVSSHGGIGTGGNRAGLACKGTEWTEPA